MTRSIPPLWLLLSLLMSTALRAEDSFQAEFVFPLDAQHNHAPGIVECPNGDLLVSWYRGSGERRADDVAVLGSRRRAGEASWSEPFLIVDTPGFPDCNTCMMIDRRERLWLFWPIVIANSWESCLTQTLVSSDYQAAGSPRWERQSNILLKPDDFSEVALERLRVRLASANIPDDTERIDEVERRLRDKLYQRLGWQPRCKPTILADGRILLPLYSDTYSFSIMAISDDEGETWTASEPLIGWGNIQPAVLQRNDGSVVAYMRENGPLNRIRSCESTDRGQHWGEVGTIDLPNPGSGLDAVRLQNGHWLLVYNDAVTNRQRLAVSISEDEGQSWRWTRHLENQTSGSYHYPAVIQGADGTIHVVYSYFVDEGKTMKHAQFSEDWVRELDN